MVNESSPFDFLDHFGKTDTHEVNETQPVAVIRGLPEIFSPDLGYFRTSLSIFPCRFQGKDFQFVSFRLPKENEFTRKQTRFVNWKEADSQEVDQIAKRYRQDLPILIGPAVKIEREEIIVNEDTHIRTLFVPLNNRLNIPFQVPVDTI